MTAVTLREANQADAKALGAVHVASWHETYAGIISGEMLGIQSVDVRTAMWNKVLGAPGQFGCIAVMVAEHRGRVIGFGSCGEQRDQALVNGGFSGEFTAIYVLRSHQGEGVGRSLITAMSKELSAAGHKAAALWVLRQNDPARAFYSKLGGVITGEKADERFNSTLIEDAYGWRDLSTFVS